jgi:glycosyltransferase involved in cell wall biosynthesis
MPPLQSAQSLQAPRILSHLAELGWQPTVLCADPASFRDDARQLDPGLEAGLSPRLEIVRAASLERAWWARWLRRLVLGLHLPGGGLMRGGKGFWAPAAIRAGWRALGAGDYAAILSFSMPWSSHLVALALARRSGLPWVAKFSDPWIDSPYYLGGPFSRWLLGWLEALVLQRADRVVFVTRRSADAVMRKYPSAWRNRVRVIPHSFDPAEKLPRGTSRQRGRLRLVHTGGLYGVRTPEPFLLGVAELRTRSPELSDRLEVLFVGTFEHAYRGLASRLGLDAIVHFWPPRSHTEAIRLAAEADVCLLIDAPSASESVFLPSKLVDYLRLGKPVLGITPARGESADLLRQVGCPVIEPDDRRGIADALAGLLAAHDQGTLAGARNYDSALAPFDPMNVARQFDTALQEASGRLTAYSG